MTLVTIFVGVLMLVTAAVCVPIGFRRPDPMLSVLDSMQRLMSGRDQFFDRYLYFEMRNCMHDFDESLPASQDSNWQGILDYWASNGTADDPWGGKPTWFHEKNATETDLSGMIIYEPCNYASNVAYYHSMLEFCKKIKSTTPFNVPKEYQRALGIQFSNLAVGSAFMHGSATILGKQQDNMAIAALSYLIHQGSLSGIATNSSILRDISAKPRNKTALEIVDAFQDMFLTQPSHKWFKITASFDLPDYELTFAALITTIVSIGFDEIEQDLILPEVLKAFKLDDEISSFILHSYLPEIRNFTSDMDGKNLEDFPFVANALGTFTKLIYAFLWQETVLVSNDFFLDPVVNSVGYSLLPQINEEINSVMDYRHFDPNFQQGRGMYPGGEWCNPVIPHAKWHLQSGIGLVDLTYLGDEVYSLLSGHHRPTVE